MDDLGPTLKTSLHLPEAQGLIREGYRTMHDAAVLGLRRQLARAIDFVTHAPPFASHRDRR
jgi:hypothetical protein